MDVSHDPARDPRLQLVLSMLDGTVSEDGRGARLRQFVFLFDEERSRESYASGLVWLEPGDPEGPGCSTRCCCNTCCNSKRAT
ncbi:MAG: hypothetical protein ABFC89_13465 [Methanospirillum sp.]